MNDLEEEYGTDQFVPMTIYSSGSYAPPGGSGRMSYYGFNGTPSATFDGTIDHLGGQSGGSMFATYNPSVLARLSVSSPLVINAAFVALGNEISLSATLQVDEPISGSNNQVHFFICIDGYHGQSNMLVEILESEPFTLSTPGESTVVTREFTLPSHFDANDMRIIAMVQDVDSKVVHQAALAGADYAGSILVDAEPNGVNAPWRLQGPENLNFTGVGDRSINVFFTGDYTLTFLDVEGWDLPAVPSVTQTLAEGDVLSYTGTYTNGPFALVQDGPLAHDGPAEGASLIDFDDDGDLDIHVLNNGAADLLLRNEGNLQFTDVATGNIADAGPGRSSAWADFNHDGHKDVFIGRDGEANLLFLGDGTPNGFTPANTIGTDDGGSAVSVSWIDFNADGKLDIYVTREAETNLLLSSFGEVGGGLFLFTQASDGAPAANSSGANWIHLNDDQRPDLYIVNRFSANKLLENTEIGFANLSGSGGIGDIADGMGSAWGDYDNDGDLDLYLANEGMADRLFENYNGTDFNLISGTNTGDMGEGRGVVMADFDQDGWLDVYVVRHGEPDLFLLGDGAGNFTTVPVGFAETVDAGNVPLCGDLDADGDLDLFITRQGASNLVLRNDLATGNYLQINLTGPETLPDAIGARVRVTTGDITRLRLVQAGTGYQAMQSRTLHFGLGDAESIDSIEITWPDGEVQTLTDQSVNRVLNVTQGANPLTPVDESTLPRRTVLSQAHPNPFNPATTISFALASSGRTSLEIYTVDGRLVNTLVSDYLDAGYHECVWTGRDKRGRRVASGTYYYRLQAPDGSQHSGRMALVK